MTPLVERRRFARAGTGELSVVAARVRPGVHVTLLNLSPGGALIGTSRRLLPGAPVDLHLQTAERHLTAAGRVVRCAVVALHSTVVEYCAAIAFDAQWLCLGTHGARERAAFQHQLPHAAGRLDP